MRTSNYVSFIISNDVSLTEPPDLIVAQGLSAQVALWATKLHSRSIYFLIRAPTVYY